ncbi:50S ribosomal protein L11 methyltransferase [Macrococcus capreoli]|uniref:50S ribosomal protein L11 methyltransferase n=1 Tax=Macrococcus capreoli TaxID=2982690 RepID=UPI0021D58169|nr:50S ribosomal protein L11 methyltransferase [Macrococcus sp. TMW 2.2395]MCU7557207.1 50S ribosomal protein L11 methyltransferase [Macrococcus sp. TMW 2.2395]
MNYKEITLMINHELEPFIADILNEVGANGVVIEDSEELKKGRIETFGEIYELDPADYPESDVRVKVYFSELDYHDGIIETIEEKINQLHDVKVTRLEISTDEVQEEDWANEWKNHFHAFKVSDKFVIVPSWESYDALQEGEHAIHLDPGMAFGTGDHATTSMCLKLIEKYVLPNQSVIDVGTGSGILSIAAHKLGAAPIKALDLDAVAVKVAQDNFEKNDCLDAITAEPGNLLKGETEKRDVIFANILAHIVDLMIDDSYALLNDNGLFITSGIIEEKETMIVEHLERVGYRILEITRDSGWIAIAARKEA